jgi:hypothetical protein
MNIDKVIKGNTPEEKFNSVDTILSRLMRRAVKTCSAIITPFPIFAYADAPTEDPIIRYLFPVGGTILKGYVFVDVMPKKGINIETTLLQADGSSMSRTFFTKKNMAVEDVMTDVVPGVRLEVSVSLVDLQESIGGVWLSFLWIPKVSNEIAMQFILDDLDKQEKEYASQGEEG